MSYNFRSSTTFRAPLADKSNQVANAGAFAGKRTTQPAPRRSSRDTTAKRARGYDDAPAPKTKKMSIEPMELAYEDIDANDFDNIKCCAEYLPEIFAHLREKEVKEAVDAGYMNDQLDINPKMRCILVDWMAEVSYKFRLLSATMFLAVHVLDRYLAQRQVPRNKLQLTGIAALLIASKVEETYTPVVADFVYICDSEFSAEEILRYEITMLNVLDFRLAPATSLLFLRRFSKAARSDSQTHTLSKYITELSLIDYALLKYKPSQVAASAVYIARAMMGRAPLWNDTLQHYTHYSESDIAECVQELNALVRKQHAPGNKQKAVRQQFSSPRLFQVSLLPPVPDLPSPTA